MLASVVSAPRLRPAQVAPRSVASAAAKPAAALPQFAGLRRRHHAAVAAGASRRGVSAAAAAVVDVVQPAQLSDEERKAWAEAHGFRTVGKELPSDVTLQDVIKSMPDEVFELNPWKAWSAVAIAVVSIYLSELLISVTPWPLLPISWFIAGTAATGWFVVGHDCGHRSFSKNKLVEDIVGTIMFMPLIYPFEPWRIKHNTHHAHTNKLVEDTAWHPVQPEQMATWSPVQAFLYKVFLGTPLKLWASVGHWLVWHFDLSKYTEAQQTRVKISLAAVAAFILIGFPTIVYYTGWWGLAKYWLMPWLGYHFWMSTFTVVHHTAPHIPFKSADEWNPAQAQLAGTVHCDYPSWVEFLCFDINVHVPHHVNSKIPWYNLRAATDSLRTNWGEYMTECTFNWRMMKYIFTECHVYDKERCYVPFDFEKEEALFAIQRKMLPEKM
eukprot:scaffold8.g1620.t1